MAKILASSLNNFVLLNNQYSVDPPYVTFTVGNPSNVTITIKDALNEDGYNKVITGSSSSVISSDSFSTNGVSVINLMECLKMNNIFFDIVLESASTIKAKIDTAIKYSITIEGSGVSVGGTYSSYNPLTPNKMVMMLQGRIDDNTTNISMEKYNNSSTVSFNITSPFSHMAFVKPMNLSVTAYQLYNNTSSMVTVPDSSIIIMPTTLTKFQDVNYDLFYGSQVVHFLTNREVRRYNYGEHIGLSLLTDSSSVTLRKNFYTNSGVFLEGQTSCEYVERNGIRTDFYDSFDLASIEARYHTNVGYVMVVAVDSGVEVSYPIRYNVIPSCSSNHEIFFLNEIGGIDSFNFDDSMAVSRSLSDISTYMKNPIRPFSDRYEIEVVNQKRNKITFTVSTKQLSIDEAEWLNELGKSKFVFLYLGTTNPKYKTIVVDRFDIETDSKSDEFELSMEYHEGDNSLTI